jgi:hypothetical protein
MMWILWCGFLILLLRTDKKHTLWCAIVLGIIEIFSCVAFGRTSSLKIVKNGKRSFLPWCWPKAPLPSKSQMKKALKALRATLVLWRLYNCTVTCVLLVGNLQATTAGPKFPKHCCLTLINVDWIELATLMSDETRGRIQNYCTIRPSWRPFR